MKEFNVGKIAPFSLCVLLAIMYFIDIHINMFTFHFAHANIFHLIGNMIAVSAIFVGMDYRYLLPAYVISSLLWLFTGGEVIGFSSIIYFMWGARVIQDFKYIFSIPEKAKRTATTYAIGISTTFILSAIIPSVSFSLHFFPFVAGVLTSATIMLIDMFKRDIKYENSRPDKRK